VPEPSSAARFSSFRHAISLLILAAAILSNLVILTRASTRDFTWSDPELRLLLGVVFAQVTLGASYFAWGRWNVALRACILIGTTFASAALTSALLAPRPRLYLSVHLTAGVLTAGTMYAIRIAGAWLAHAEYDNDRPRQFSLLDVLSLVTAAALLTAATRCTEWPSILLGEALRWTLVAVATGLPSFVFPLITPKWWQGALVAFLITAAFLAFLIWQRDVDEWYLLLALAQYAVVVLCCSLLRLAGYELRDPWLSRSPTR
jgi:hypothetical protein